MVFEVQNEKAIVVVLNYNFPNFQILCEDARNRKILTNYNFENRSMPLHVRGQVSPEFLQQMALSSPSMAISAETAVKMTFSPQEAKLILEKEHFNKESDFENFAAIAEGLIDSKISDITAIGLNFSAEFNLGALELNLFNNQLFEIESFKKSASFEFILPVKYETHTATYRIVKSENQENNLYEIAVNCHFELSDRSAIERVKKIQSILGGYYYEAFLKTANEFLKLNNKAC